MSVLTVELKNDTDLELFIAFASKLNAVVLDVKKVQNDKSKTSVIWLEKLAGMGGIKSIEEPSKWQQEIRQDKILIGREK